MIDISVSMRRVVIITIGTEDERSVIFGFIEQRVTFRGKVATDASDRGLNCFDPQTMVGVLTVHSHSFSPFSPHPRVDWIFSPNGNCPGVGRGCREVNRFDGAYPTNLACAANAV